MKFGDLINGVVKRFDDKGRGVFVLTRPNAPDRDVAIPFTTVGDDVEAKFVKRDKHMIVGELTRVVAPGPDRVPPAPRSPRGEGGYPSDTLDKYPGGLWMHIEYAAQVRFKRDMINRAFENAGHEERVDVVIPSSVTKQFRNRMDYAVSWDGKIGLKEFGSWNRYREVIEDPLLSDTTPIILDACKQLFTKFDLKPWDNKKIEGDVRYVIIREGKKTGDRLVGLIVKDLSRVTDAMKDYLREALDKQATTIVIGENPLITDLSIAQTIVPLKGDGTLNEVVNDTTYRIHLNSFFQTNSIMSATLQDVVADLIFANHKPQTINQILDLYCGLGFFGINLAKRDPSLRVSGFEIDANAIELAKENAQTNGVADRCDFTSGPAEDLSWKDIDTDVVILDPPRAGLHPRVVKTILEKKPKEIVYVSCNYHRLVEELKQLKAIYEITDLKAVDMFPHTPHVEVVVKLVLSEK